MAQFVERSFKSILNKRKFIDSWFWDRYSLNPYNGCQLGCVYCNSRSDRYRMPEDFENEIVIKSDVGGLLDRRISRARTLLPDVVTIAGVTDGYQPAERKYRSTRRALEVLHKHRYPVHIITKSAGVLEDAELLDAIGQQTWCSVSVTVSTTDEEAAAFLDGRAPSPARRLEVVRELRARAPNVQAGVLAIPIVPFLGDSYEQLRKLVDAVAECGAHYLLFGGGMTLRDTQGAWFARQLQERYPEWVQPFADLYGDRHDPPYAYSLRVHETLFARCAEKSLPWRIPRFVPEDFRAANYRIAEELLGEAYRLQMLGGDWANTYWAGQNIQNLTESIEGIASRGELGTIRNVRGALVERILGMLNG